MSLADEIRQRPVPLPRMPAVALPARVVVVAIAGAALCAAAVTISMAETPSDAAFGRGLLELLIVGTPMVAGVYALRTPGNARFGVALIAVGTLWSLTALAQTPGEWTHTIGRLATWLIFPCVVYLLLAFPSGRVAKGLDRFVLGGVIAVLTVLFIGTAPLVEAFPPKTLWSICSTDCPSNALFVLDQQPAFLDDLIRVREWLVQLLWIGIFASMYRRWRAASPAQLRAIAPVFLTGAAMGALHSAHITARQAGLPTDTVVALSSAWTLAIIAVCVAFLVGLVRRRTLIASSLMQLSMALRADTSPAGVRDALAEAVGDPSLELYLVDPRSGDAHDSAGRPRSWPLGLPDGRSATVLRSDDTGDDVVLVHSAALCDDRDLLDAVGATVISAWRHDRVLADLTRAMSELERSRRRIAEAAQLERVRIERDLHDGAQQRLIALRMRLALAEDLARDDAPEAAKAIHALDGDVERALEEIRSLAQGIYPALLANRGLDEALQSVARRAPLPTTVDAQGLTRHRAEIESAVYFTCLEALQNAAKHGQGATGARLTLREGDELVFEIADDGVGYDPSTSRIGAGLRNMRDRVESLGGRLSVCSSRGHGTIVTGAIPLVRP